MILDVIVELTPADIHAEYYTTVSIRGAQAKTLFFTW
jgi:hypothetical protein